MIKVVRDLPLFLLILALYACTGEKNTEPVKQADGAVKALSTAAPLAAPSSKEITPQDNQKVTLLEQSLQLQVFELPSEAIPVWRNFRSTKPALIILSQAPMFGTVPESLRTEANHLVMTADSKSLRVKANNQLANPVLLPQQSVAASLDAGFFSEVLWILPQKEKDELSLEVFRQQMIDSGTLWHEEAATIKDENGLFHGKARGYPFTACPIDRLPQVKGASLVHFDLSYFSNLFDNEITTPLFPLVHETLQRLRQAKLHPLAATLSLGNREGGVPLEIRFLKNLLTDTLQNPSLLDQPLPELLSMRKDARYMETFFQTDGILTIYSTMEKLASNDPSIQYDLYRAYSTAREFDLAMRHLDKAIRIDPGYGVEYLHLAIKSLDKKNLEEGLEYMQKFARLEPGNPLITLQLADLYLNTGKKKEVLGLINTLRQEKWSTIYFPEVPQILEEMQKKVEG